MARRLYSHAATSIGEIRQTVWVNPGNPDEKLLQWLLESAPAEAKRQIGFNE
jgi:hypothetical protein